MYLYSSWLLYLGVEQLQNTGCRALPLSGFALWNSSCTVSGLMFFEGSVAKSHVQGAYEETKLDMKKPVSLWREKKRVHTSGVSKKSHKLACLNRKGLVPALPGTN